MFRRLIFKATLCVVFLLILQFSLIAKEGVFCVYKPDRTDNKTASGQIFNENAMTCAHSSLKFGTKIYASYNGNLAEFSVNDRIKEADDVFAVTPGVLKKLGAYEQGALKLSYSIVEQGDGVDEWSRSVSDTKWLELRGITSSNLFATHSNLLALNLKSRYDAESNSLTLLYVNKSDYSRIMDILSKLDIDTQNISSVQLERNPLRQ